MKTEHVECSICTVICNLKSSLTGICVGNYKKIYFKCIMSSLNVYLYIHMCNLSVGGPASILYVFVMGLH